jgi:hypothetical protein
MTAAAAAAFKPIQLYHDYSLLYDCSIPRCLPIAIAGYPAQNPILAIVEALLFHWTIAGRTEEEIVEYVRAAYSNYSVDIIEAAFDEALRQGVLVKLVPNQIGYCCGQEGCPTPTFTYAPEMDRNPANHSYVAYLYTQITSDPVIKKNQFFNFFRPKPCGGAGYANKCC